ncbi:MAG: uroporphyrinogen-III synthase [Francisellaceae bacterium]
MRFACHGVSAFHLPVFEFEAVLFDLSILSQSFTDVIFTSRQAVTYFFSQSPEAKERLSHCAFWSIGATTASRLAQFGLPSNYPINRHDSETLLELLGDLTGRHILLVKGQKGREFLTEQISQVAELQVLECYRRRFRPESELKSMLSAYHHSPQLIIFSSFAGLLAAMPIFKWRADWMHQSIITVTNNRMLDWASHQGFAKLYLVDALTNDALLKTGLSLLGNNEKKG